MPTRGRPNQHFRIDPESWDRFGQAAEQARSDRSTLLRQFISWFNREPGSRLPRRPEAPTAE